MIMFHTSKPNLHKNHLHKAAVYFNAGSAFLALGRRQEKAKTKAVCVVNLE